jgi:protein-tyrosine phosphatase
MTQVFDLRQTDDARDMIHRTVQALSEGNVVGLPTDTVYGLAAHALNPGAVARLLELTGSGSSPLAISVRSRQSAEDFYWPASGLAKRLSHRCWPGPLTLVTPVPTLIQRSPAYPHRSALRSPEMAVKLDFVW